MSSGDTVAQPAVGDGDRVAVPAFMVPAFRTWKAIEKKVERNLLFRTWGGLGDQVCAEPTLRYVLKSFPDCDISLASEQPEMFAHLKFKRVFDLREEQPIYDKYFLFDTIVPPTHLTWQFFSHCVTNCVDFPALCSIRSQLPCRDREIMLTGTPPGTPLWELTRKDYVFVHAGRHWPSKTFPKPWWDAVLKRLQDCKLTPVLIGADTDDNRGTVDVDPTGCVDLRNKTTVGEMIWLLQRASVLLTNDSSPLHIAASTDPTDLSTGNCWIGYVATCKHPDYITHFRKGQWQWREENLGLGGMWEITDHCPNKENEVTVDKVDLETLKSWLPEPEAVVNWVLSKLS